MFSFRSRKKALDISRYLRRICDATTPNSGLTPRLKRIENRYNRTLPVMLWMWEDERPVADSCFIGVTKDITDRGIGLILATRLTGQELVIGILSDQSETAEPWFFRGEAVRGKYLGAGYSLYGMRIVEFLNRDRPHLIEALTGQANRLRPNEPVAPSSATP